MDSEVKKVPVGDYKKVSTLQPSHAQDLSEDQVEKLISIFFLQKCAG